MFNEKKEEMGLPVWISPKYEESKKKALDLINSKLGKEAGIGEGDFWILMNKTKNKDKMAYTGLIISHNGCLKLNSIQAKENQFMPNSLTLDKNGWGGSLVYTYSNDAQGIYEVGEISTSNCQNDYPYAMALKRVFDRVVLKVTQLAFAGIYSDSEADEFKEQPEEREVAKETKTPIAKGQPISVASEPMFLEPKTDNTVKSLISIINNKVAKIEIPLDKFNEWLVNKYATSDLFLLDITKLSQIIKFLEQRETKVK